MGAGFNGSVWGNKTKSLGQAFLKCLHTFIGTYRNLAEKVGVSYDTVSRTITLLLGKGFLKKIQTGVYQVSPTIIMKGSEHKKQLLLNYYDDEPNGEPEPEAKE